MAFVDSKKPYLIAEVSSNHQGDLKRCFDFVDTASELGFDAVKFQLFEVEKLFSKEALTAKPELLERKKWELPLDFIPRIKERCTERGIDFGCTPFHLEAVEFLKNYVDFFKIASYELLWDELLVWCARTGINTIISTGMANLDEINHAVKILRANNCEPTILHCVSAYPTPSREVNLSAIQTIRNETGCETGWSDHTTNPAVIYRAIHRWGAKVIEFHLDLEGKGEEFSSGHCWLPGSIEEVIKNVQYSESFDGDGLKQPQPSEKDDREWRADPSDGLRPLKSVRNNYEG